MAARRYDFYLRVVKTIFYERAQRVSKILFLTLEDKSHIFKPPCNIIIYYYIVPSKKFHAQKQIGKSHAKKSLYIFQYLTLLYNKYTYK
jgi:hypothetical protein